MQEETARTTVWTEQIDEGILIGPGARVDVRLALFVAVFIVITIFLLGGNGCGWTWSGHRGGGGEAKKQAKLEV